MEKREIEVLVCDFCGQEVENLERCANCGREGCLGAKKDHWAYRFDLYCFDGGERFAGYGTYICKECEDIIKVFDHLVRWWTRKG